MKSKQKELLCRARPELLRSLEISHVLPALRGSGHLSHKEEADLMGETARRKRVSKLLDLLEKKKTEAFDVFVDALEENYTHLYLQLTGFETSYDLYDQAGLDCDTDEWSNIRRARDCLIEEVDAMKVAPILVEKQVLTEAEFKEIRSAGDTEKRTECLLDLLETKPHSAVDIVIDAIGDSYPHLYLILTGDRGLDDDFL